MAPQTALPREDGTRAPIASWGLALAVAGVLFLLAVDGGSFGETSRDTLAIAIWWVVLLAVAAGLWPVVRLERAAVVAGALLLGFAVWTLASAGWADSAGKAFVEFNRASLYAGVFLLAAFAATRATLVRWSDGLALAIVATGAVAFFTRCFPDVVDTQKNLRALPLDLTRLTYPLGYWNGLAIFAALAVPLLLRVAASTAHPVLRAVSVAPFPLLAAVVFLTSSRGGVATAVVGVVALAALAPSVRMLGAAAFAALGAVGGVAIVAPRTDLVNAPGAAAAHDGHVAFALVAVACVVIAALYFAAVHVLTPRFRLRAPRLGRAGRVAVATVAVVVVAAGVMAAHPVRAFDRFTEPPAYALNTLPKNTSIQRHLLSGGSSGRWQQWETVMDEFRSAPAAGRGAGSYEAWWAQHGSLRGYVKDAHSLYLETLGELGIVGFVLIVGALATGVVSGVRRALASTPERRLVVAALWAVFVAYAFAAGVDWMWEMTVVSVVGIALLGLLTGRASMPERWQRPSSLAFRRDLAVRAAIVVVGLCLIAAEADSLLANRELEASKAAVSTDELSAAFKRADNARKIQPWAASPYQQLALVDEEAGDYAGASRWIQKAIHRDPTDFRLWFLAARFSTKQGKVRRAATEVRRSRQLSPRSDLWTR